MLESFFAKMPLKTKIKLGFKALGVTNDEMSALNSLIGDVKSNDLLGLLVPENIRTVDDILESQLVQTAGTDTQLIPQGRVAGFLHNDFAAGLAGKFVEGYLVKHPQYESQVVSVFGKLISTHEGFDGREFASMAEMVSEGVIPALRRIVPLPDKILAHPSGQPAEIIIFCRHCGKGGHYVAE